MLYLVPTIYRFKYYFAWGVAESGLTLSGFNYNGEDERGMYLWDRYVNARIMHVESQTSLAKLPEHWNVCTGLFLRQCKVFAKLSKTLQLLIVVKSMLSFTSCSTLFLMLCIKSDMLFVLPGVTCILYSGHCRTTQSQHLGWMQHLLKFTALLQMCMRG